MPRTRTTAALLAALSLVPASIALAQAGIVTDGDPIAKGETVNGTLEEGDEKMPEDNSLFDPFVLQATGGESYTITLESDDFDSLIFVFDERGNLIAFDDDGFGGPDGGTLNAQVTLSPEEDTAYIVYANAVFADETGAYALAVK